MFKQNIYLSKFYILGGRFIDVKLCPMTRWMKTPILLDVEVKMCQKTLRSNERKEEREGKDEVTLMNLIEDIYKKTLILQPTPESLSISFNFRDVKSNFYGV